MSNDEKPKYMSPCEHMLAGAKVCREPTCRMFFNHDEPAEKPDMLTILRRNLRERAERLIYHLRFEAARMEAALTNDDMGSLACCTLSRDTPATIASAAHILHLLDQSAPAAGNPKP